MSMVNRQLATTNGQLTTDKSQRPFIPYARQWIDEDDIQAVVEVLRSDWLTTGPKVAEFERAFADFVGAKEAVAFSSGTAALHAAMYAMDIGPGDEVILPPMTFVSTANAVVFQGGTPIFVDVDQDTLLIDPNKVQAKITPRIKAIIAVDYAGQPCDYGALEAIAKEHDLILVADACHALGAEYKGKKVGTLADLTVFSFHPVKHITTGEGGMITTDDHALAERMRLFRNHGITRNPEKFVHFPPFATTKYPKSQIPNPKSNSAWYYEMQDLGYNYRMTDFQCALGLSQLRKLPLWITRRQEIAKHYDAAFAETTAVQPLSVRPELSHAYHLYVITLNMKYLGTTRAEAFAVLWEEGIGVNVHYIPVHLHPFYRDRFGTGKGLCPIAEAAYEQILSLPMSAGMTDQNVERVISTMIELINK
jgi:perosamine synthetase